MWFAVFVQQNIPWLDVTVQNAVFMRVMNCACQFGNQFHRVPDRHRLAPDGFVKLTAFDELHAEVARPIALAYFVDGNDSRMIEARGSFGFSAKTLQVRFARPLTKANDF